MRRFYKATGISKNEKGYAITLDERAVRTPAGATLTVVSRALAEAIAGEWEAQGEEIEPQTMPLTRLAATTLDHVGASRDKIIAEALQYATMDLLCYRAEAPALLAQRQAEAWQPLLDWAAKRHRAPLVVTAEIAAIDQPASSLAALEAALCALDDPSLAALQDCAGICHSLILGLALVEGEISAEAAWEISQLDENFQIERWGSDTEAEKRREILRADLMAVERFLSLGR
ncbi:MAG: ATPase [Alphaproteobacteria bacterium]|nr:ATPase [Alphaproteobacteria bacterium]